MSWNRGLNKYTSESVLKISQTFKIKHIDNFKEWRDRMRELGKIPSDYPEFTKGAELAELIGVALGDGNISRFPRTERIIIVGNSNNPGFINRYSYIIEKIFNKKPVVSKIRGANCIRISLYQKFISKRLGIPSGNRGKMIYTLPLWIKNNKVFLTSFLKGLFEAEASLSIHLKTYTYNFQFSNLNENLLNIVKDGLISLGYNPEIRKISIRLRKKHEVEAFKNLIKFRDYNAG